MKLRTKITLLICAVLVAILFLNHYPVSMSLRQSVLSSNASALQDLTNQLAAVPDLAAALQDNDSVRIAKLVKQTQDSEHCSGLAIFSLSGALYYDSLYGKSDDKTPHPSPAEIIQEDTYHQVSLSSGDSIIYVTSPILDAAGNTLGHIIANAHLDQDPPELQKALRDLNAMTILVMIIALIFVWDLTDNIKGTMFQLEPVEIAQILVERNSLIDAVRDGILSVDYSGRFLHTNSTAHALLTRALGTFDPETNTFSDVFSHSPLQELLASKTPCYDCECKIGNDTVYANFIPIHIEKPKHSSLLITFRPKQDVVRFAEDITGVKSYIEALRSQMHEFNNKLQVVSGLVREEKYPELEEFVQGLIHLKHREMEQITKKIRDPILSAFLLSKFDRAAERKVDLILTDRTDQHSPLSPELVQDLVVIIGNFLENAFDAVQGCAMQTVTLEVVESAGEMEVCVWDSGISIPPEIQESLFDYGITGKADGNGIGLYLVQQACNRYNGYIKVASDPLDGTEFVAHIPLPHEDGISIPTNQ